MTILFSDSILEISGKVYCLKTQLWLMIQFFTWYPSALTTVTCWFWLLNVVMRLYFLPFSDVIISSTDESYERSSCKSTRHEVTCLSGVLLTQISTLGESGWSTSHHVHFTPAVGDCSFHWMEPELELGPVWTLWIKTKYLTCAENRTTIKV